MSAAAAHATGRGIAMMVGGAGLLLASDVFTKHLAATYPPGQVLCLRQGVALAALVPVILAAAPAGALRVSNWPGQILRGLLFVAGAGAMVLALGLLPLSIAASIALSSPLFVALFAIPILGERVRWQLWLATLVGFGGVLVILRPGGAGFELALLLPLLVAVCNALRDALTRRLARTESSISILFWTGVIVTLAGLATAPFGWQPLTGPAAIWFLLAGLCNALAHFAMIEALRLAPASIVSPFKFSGVLWALAFGLAVYGEVPDAALLGGAALIVAAGVSISRTEARRA